MNGAEPIPFVAFFRAASGNEPVREWLKSLPRLERRIIGEDIKTVQFGWPLGMPLVRKLDKSLWEVAPACPTGLRESYSPRVKAGCFCSTASSKNRRRRRRKNVSLGANTDPQRDCLFTKGLADVLDHATSKIAIGSKLGRDATGRFPGEGFKRPRPPLIKMDAAVKAKVEDFWGNEQATSSH